MAITPNFTQADVANRLDAFVAAIERRIISRLQYLGEMCVTHARNNGSYLNQTGNLRSSIGYVIFKDGVMIRKNFDASLDKTGYTETWTNIKSKKEHSKRIQGDGIATGMELAKKVGARYSKGYVLVVVAGMGYAAAVESKGRDVLASSEILAKKQLPMMIEQLKSNISKAIR